METNLSSAELAVLAEHLSVDPRFAIGDRSANELSELKAEGLRSLIARRLFRFDDERPLISTGLAELGADILAPKGLLTYTRFVDDRAHISTVLVGRGGMISATPLAEDVGAYVTTTPSRVVEAVVGELAAGNPEGGVYRVEGVNGIEQRSEGVITWAQSPNGEVARFDEGETVASDPEEIRGLVEDMVLALSAIEHGRDASGGGL